MRRPIGEVPGGQENNQPNEAQNIAPDKYELRRRDTEQFWANFTRLEEAEGRQPGALRLLVDFAGDLDRIERD